MTQVTCHYTRDMTCHWSQVMTQVLVCHVTVHEYITAMTSHYQSRHYNTQRLIDVLIHSIIQ
jgi:hypothetical protein